MIPMEPTKRTSWGVSKHAAISVARYSRRRGPWKLIGTAWERVGGDSHDGLVGNNALGELERLVQARSDGQCPL
jgi:hypothetical protein